MTRQIAIERLVAAASALAAIPGAIETTLIVERDGLRIRVVARFEPGGPVCAYQNLVPWVEITEGYDDILLARIDECRMTMATRRREGPPTGDLTAPRRPM